MPRANLIAFETEESLESTVARLRIRNTYVRNKPTAACFAARLSVVLRRTFTFDFGRFSFI